ncbi:alpha/beta fold hydrolase [Dermacoccaceae bacterium W4C1]
MSTMHYVRSGSGVPVVLVHGIGHHGPAWGAVPELLATDHDVIVVDLPGHGRSARVRERGGYAVPQVMTMFEALFDELGVDRPHIAGNSLGGFLSLHLAARGAVSSAVALSPAGFGSRAEVAGVAATQLMAMRAFSHVPQPALRKLNASPARRKATLGSIYRHGDRRTVDEVMAETLNLRQAKGFWPFFGHLTVDGAYRGRPSVPVTVAWAEKDRLLLPRQAERARRRLPEANHVTLTGCGHVAMLDDPEQVARVIRTQVEQAGATA